MTVAAPASFEPAMAAHPTPPQPKTATESPRADLAGVHGRAEPGHDAAAEQPDRLRPGGGVDLGALPGRHEGPLGEGADAQGGRSGVPSASVICCVALWVAKQYQGRPRRQARHSPHTARQLRTTKSPGATWSRPGPTASTTPGGLVAEQEGEVVVDAALPVVQVGVAHAAGLDGDHGLARPGVGHQDRLEGRRAPPSPWRPHRRLSLPCLSSSSAPRGPVGPRRRVLMMPIGGGLNPNPTRQQEGLATSFR